MTWLDQQGAQVHSLLTEARSTDATAHRRVAIECDELDLAVRHEAARWLLVLQAWSGENNEVGLSDLETHVRLGVEPWTAAKCRQLVRALNPKTLRKLMAAPPDAELRKQGGSQDQIDAVTSSLRLTAEQLKAMLPPADDGLWRRMFGAKPELKLVPMKYLGNSAQSSIENIRDLRLIESDAGAEQLKQRAFELTEHLAALHTLLGTVLWLRFGQGYATPSWALPLS